MATTATGRASQGHAFSTCTHADAMVAGTGPSGAANRSRSAEPQPRSVSLATARPVEAATSGPILPFTGMPSLSIPVGHMPRVSISTPTCASCCSARTTLDSSMYASNHDGCPAAARQVSQRPQSAAVASSSDSWRKRMRHTLVVSYDTISCCSRSRAAATRSYRSSSYTHGCPVASQPP